MNDGEARYREALAAYLRGEDVRDRRGRPWPKNASVRTAARLMLKRMAMNEHPIPLDRPTPIEGAQAREIARLVHRWRR